MKWFGKRKVGIVEDVRFFGTKDVSRAVSSGKGLVKGFQVEPRERSINEFEGLEQVGRFGPIWQFGRFGPN